MSPIYIDREIEDENGNFFDVEIVAVVGEGGIGNYEYWGSKCNDSYPEIYSIECNNLHLLTKEQKKIVLDTIYKCEFDDEIFDKYYN